MTIKEAGVKLTAEGASSFVSEMERANKALLGFGESGKTAGGHMGIFKEMAVGALREVGRLAVDAALEVTHALVDMGKSTIEEAAKFQTMTQQIQNNTKMTDGDLKTMRQGILSLGASTGSSFDELANGFMHITNLTGDTAHAMDILSVANESAVSTGGNVTETANVLANAMHEFKFDVQDAAGAWGGYRTETEAAAHVMGVMHLAAAESNMTLEQFATSGGQVFAWAANLHIPMEDASAAFATMTKHGFDAAEAGTQVKDMMEHLIKPSKGAAEEIANVSKATGVDLVRDFSAAGVSSVGLHGVLEDLHTAFSKMGLSEADQTAEIMKMIPNIRGGTAAFTLLGQGADDYRTILADLNNQTKVNQVTEDAFNKIKATAGYQWSVLTQTGKELSIEVGTIMLPVLANLMQNVFVPGIKHVTDFVSAIASAQDPFKELLKQVDKISPPLGLLIAVGHDVAVSFGKDGMAGAFQTLLRDLPLFGPAGTAVGVAVSTLRDAFTTAFPLIKGAVAGVWDWMSQTAWPWIHTEFGWLSGTGMPAVKAEFVADWPAIKTAVMDTWSWMKDTVWPNLKESFGWLANTAVPQVTKAFTDGWPQDKAAVNDVYVFLKDQVFPFFRDSFSELDTKTLPNNGTVWAHTMQQNRQSIDDFGTAYTTHRGVIKAGMADEQVDLLALGNSWADRLNHMGDVSNQWAITLHGVFVNVGSYFAGLGQTIAADSHQIEADVNAIPGKIAAAFSGMGTLLVSAGKALLDGLGLGIDQGWQSVATKLAHITAEIPTWKGPPERDAMLLYESGVLIMRGFQQGLEASMPAVKQSLGSFTASVGATVDTTAMTTAIQAMITVVSSGVDALDKLKDFVPPARSKLLAFSSAMRDLVADFAARSQEVGYALKDKAATEFATTAASAVGVLGTGVDAFTKLKDFAAPPRDRLMTFTYALRDTVADFWARAREVLYALHDDDAPKFVDLVTKAVAVIGTGIDVFTKLKDYEGVAPGRMAAIGADMKTAAQLMIGISGELDTKGMEGASKFATSATAVFTLFKTGTESLDSIRNYQTLPPNRMALVAADFKMATDWMEKIAANANMEGIDKAAKFSTASTAIFSLFKVGVDALDAIRKFQSVPRDRMQAVAADFFDATWWMGEIAKNTDQTGLAKADKFATTSDLIFKSFQAGVGALDAIRKYQSVPKERLQAFFDDMVLAIQKMAELETQAGGLLSGALAWKSQMEAFRDAMVAGAAALAAGNAARNGGGSGSGGGSGDGGSGWGSSQTSNPPTTPPPGSPSAPLFPPASATQQHASYHYATTWSNTYNYAPTYGAAPNSPVTDFGLMRAGNF